MQNRFFLAMVLVLVSTAGAWGGEIRGQVSFNGVVKSNAAVHLEGISKAVKPPSKGVAMIQKKQTFIPSVLPVVKGTKVFLPNKDTVFHNAFSLSKGNAFDLGKYGPGKNPDVVMNEPGLVDVFCNMHEQMHASIIVLEHPYHTLTDKEGGFSIKNVPEGSYEIKAWVSPRVSKKLTVDVPAKGGTVLNFQITK